MRVIEEINPIKIGTLRHRVTIEQRTDGGKNEFGEPSADWSTFATVWARIETPTGREVLAAKSYGATVSHILTIRYRSGVLPTMRVVYGSRIFLIAAAVDMEERGRGLRIYATEVTA